MKSRHRPPLNLTDPEPETPETDAVETVAEVSDVEIVTEADIDAEPDAAPELAPLPEPRPERPMSERRRRRLEEERRQAEARAADAPALSATLEPVTTPAFAESVAAPPAIHETAPPPAKTDKPPVGARKAGGSAYVYAGLASALWIGGVASWLAYEIGSGAVALEPLRLAVYALIALAPAGLAIMLAHAVRQGAGLAAETRRARELSDAMVAPTALAARQTGEVLLSLRGDIDQAAVAAERARNDMALLRQALSEETTRLNEAAETAGRTARRLAETLGRERDQMQTLGVQLDSQATGVMDAVERQSRMVVDASDLAQTQLREAEAALAARAADLAAAAGEAQDAARGAADDLARQTLRLESAGSGVAEQIQSVEEGLGQQRAALVTAAYALRTDQEDFSAQLESQRAQLTEHLSATRGAAADLTQTSTGANEAIRELVEAAADQFRALIDMSQREADSFDGATKLALDRFEALAAEARDALVEETRRALATLEATAGDARDAAEAATDQARIRADRLNESLFDAAQKADQAAEARIEGARRIVGETAGLVDEAGQQALERLEAMVERMNVAMAQVETSLVELDERAAALPDQARERVEAMRSSVENGLAALAAASRKAAEDTEALDATFQERVRRNYDMLTEAVRLMGVVSGDAPAPGRRRELNPMVEPEAPATPARPARATEGRGFGLRGRLKLEPTEPKRAAAPPAQDGLDWADLVDDGGDEAPLDLDSPLPPPAEPAELADRITGVIRRMGVDPNALLPRSRVEEAAEALAAREPDRARQIVRRVAPAAVRSVSRRVLADAEVKADVERYVHDFGQGLTAMARAGDADGIQSRLASDAGRAFMLLDAAVGDLG